MPITLEIVPLSRSIDMFGSVHTSTAYSLSGHILIHLTRSVSLFDSQPRPPSALLTSLTITFEGKSECISPQLGYNSARVCRIQKELVKSSDEPIALIPRAAEDKDNQTEWNWEVVFDLSIPGWLPATTIVDEKTETSYSLFATATFAPNVEFETPSPPNPTSIFSPLAIGTTYPTRSPYYNTLASLFKKASSTLSLYSIPLSRSSKPKLVEAASVSITVTRHRTPPSSLSRASSELTHPDGPSLFPLIAQWGETGVKVKGATAEASKIPLEVLKGIDVLLAYPEFVGADEGKIPVSLRVKTTLDENVSKKLRLHEFDVEVDQIETYRAGACSRYVNMFPLPPPTQQPPSIPLLNPHPYESLYDMGLVMPGPRSLTATTVVERALVPDGGVIHYRPMDGEVGIPLDGRWSKMDVSVPLSGCAEGKMMTASSSPFHSVVHEIRLAISVSYHEEGEEVKKEMLYCEFPLRFTHTGSSTSSSHSSTLTTTATPLYTNHSPTHSVFDLKLPAYSQLFHENGDRKEDDDDGCFLPAYKPKGEEDTFPLTATPTLA